MEQRAFGDTGLIVSVLGLGGGQIGEAWIDEATAARVLHAARDAGVRLIDTARGYGTSEERIGRHLGACARSAWRPPTATGSGPRCGSAPTRRA